MVHLKIIRNARLENVCKCKYRMVNSSRANSLYTTNGLQTEPHTHHTVLYDSLGPCNLQSENTFHDLVALSLQYLVS